MKEKKVEEKICELMSVEDNPSGMNEAFLLPCIEWKIASMGANRQVLVELIQIFFAQIVKICKKGKKLNFLLFLYVTKLHDNLRLVF